MATSGALGSAGKGIESPDASGHDGPRAPTEFVATSGRSHEIGVQRRLGEALPPGREEVVDPMIKGDGLPAARDSRVPATVRTEELALISRELADANSLISNELADANVLLAKTTLASAELLAKTTQASAELLAKITQESADQLRKSNAISTKVMNRLTIILVAVGFIQIAVTAIALFARSN